MCLLLCSTNNIPNQEVQRFWSFRRAIKWTYKTTTTIITTPCGTILGSYGAFQYHCAEWSESNAVLYYINKSHQLSGMNNNSQDTLHVTTMIHSFITYLKVRVTNKASKKKWRELFTKMIQTCFPFEMKLQLKYFWCAKSKCIGHLVIYKILTMSCQLTLLEETF